MSAPGAWRRCSHSPASPPEPSRCACASQQPFREPPRSSALWRAVAGHRAAVFPCRAFFALLVLSALWAGLSPAYADTGHEALGNCNAIADVHDLIACKVHRHEAHTGNAGAAAKWNAAKRLVNGLGSDADRALVNTLPASHRTRILAAVPAAAPPVAEQQEEESFNSPRAPQDDTIPAPPTLTISEVSSLTSETTIAALMPPNIGDCPYRSCLIQKREWYLDGKLVVSRIGSVQNTFSGLKPGTAYRVKARVQIATGDFRLGSIWIDSNELTITTTFSIPSPKVEVTGKGSDWIEVRPAAHDLRRWPGAKEGQLDFYRAPGKTTDADVYNIRISKSYVVRNRSKLTNGVYRFTGLTPATKYKLGIAYGYIEAGKTYTTYYHATPSAATTLHAIPSPPVVVTGKGQNWIEVRAEEFDLRRWGSSAKGLSYAFFIGASNVSDTDIFGATYRSGAQTGRTYRFTGLTANTEYKIGISYGYRVGMVSDAYRSPPATVSTPANLPGYINISEIGVSRTTTSLTVEVWNSQNRPQFPDGTTFEFDITYDGKTLRTDTSSTPRHVITGLTPGRTYKIIARAILGDARRIVSRIMTTKSLGTGDPSLHNFESSAAAIQNPRARRIFAYVGGPTAKNGDPSFTVVAWQWRIYDEVLVVDDEQRRERHQRLGNFTSPYQGGEDGVTAYKGKKVLDRFTYVPYLAKWQDSESLEPGRYWVELREYGTQHGRTGWTRWSKTMPVIKPDYIQIEPWGVTAHAKHKRTIKGDASIEYDFYAEPKPDEPLTVKYRVETFGTLFRDFSGETTVGTDGRGHVKLLSPPFDATGKVKVRFELKDAGRYSMVKNRHTVTIARTAPVKPLCLDAHFDDAGEAAQENGLPVDPKIIVGRGNHCAMRVESYETVRMPLDEMFSGCTVGTDCNVTIKDTYGHQSSVENGVLLVTGPVEVGAKITLLNLFALDDSDSDDETITFNPSTGATITGSNKQVAAGAPASRGFTFYDDDDADLPLTVSFAKNTFDVNERAGPAQPVLRVKQAGHTVGDPIVVDRDVTYRVTATSGTATLGTDTSNSGPWTVTNTAGQFTQSFNVKMVNDLLEEGDETFTVTIDPASLPSGVTIGDHGSATVRIIDNDAPTPILSLRRANIRVYEGIEAFVNVHNTTKTAYTGTVVINLSAKTSGDPPVANAAASAMLGNDPTVLVTRTVTVPGNGHIRFSLGSYSDTQNLGDGEFDLTILASANAPFKVPEYGGGGSLTVVDDDQSTSESTLSCNKFSFDLEDLGRKKEIDKYEEAKRLDRPGVPLPTVSPPYKACPYAKVTGKTQTSVSARVSLIGPFDDAYHPQTDLSVADRKKITAGIDRIRWALCTGSGDCTNAPTQERAWSLAADDFVFDQEDVFTNLSPNTSYKLELQARRSGTWGWRRPVADFTTQAVDPPTPPTVKIAMDTADIAEPGADPGYVDRLITLEIDPPLTGDDADDYVWVDLCFSGSASYYTDFHIREDTRALDGDYNNNRLAQWDPRDGKGNCLRDPVYAFNKGSEHNQKHYLRVMTDNVDEGAETLTMTLKERKGESRQNTKEGVEIGPAVTVTITNDGPIPAAWLARFGRTVAEQALDGIAGRVAAPRSPGVRGRLAGQPLRTGTASANPAPPARPEFGSGFGEAHTETMTAREALLASHFTATGERDAAGGSLALWGRASQSRFEGREGALILDGEVTTGMLGADYARGDWLVGLALTQSEAEGGHDGEVEASLTAAVPYVALYASERLTLWGAAGFGSGEMTLRDRATTYRPDIDWTMAAAGLRSELMAAPAEGSGPSLVLASDAFWARTRSDAVSGATGNLAASDSDVTRLRLGLEGSWRVALDEGGYLTPKLEVGARHDGGDAETGLGVELGGGLAWSAPALGLELDVTARTLIAHGDDDFEERGLAASLVFDPDPATERGASLTLRQELGAPAEGGLDALFAPAPWTGRGAGEAAPRWAAEAAYGFPAFGGRFTASPHAGLGLATGARDYTLGWRLAPARSAPELSFGVKATRRESDGADPEHDIGFEVHARW